jgi:hypothetical protein
LYCFGAMVELVSGLNGCVYNGFRSGLGLMYCSMDGVRPLSRSEARMADVAMKRATAARKSLVRREEATVSSSICMHQCGEAAISGVLR